MLFARTTKLSWKIIKNIKQHFKIFLRSSISPTNQDPSNDTTPSQIKSRVPVPSISTYRYLGIGTYVKLTKLKADSINGGRQWKIFKGTVSSDFKNCLKFQDVACVFFVWLLMVLSIFCCFVIFWFEIKV
jgi:hypothetical protein